MLDGEEFAGREKSARVRVREDGPMREDFPAAGRMPTSVLRRETCGRERWHGRETGHSARSEAGHKSFGPDYSLKPAKKASTNSAGSNRAKSSAFSPTPT
jgi:hypothetical protein